MKASAMEQDVADAQDLTNSYGYDKRNDHRGLTLDDYVHSYGLQLHFKPALKSFVKDVTSGKESFSESAGKPLDFVNATTLRWLRCVIFLIVPNILSSAFF